ncbi:MAG: ParB/RepB/Spo0J family partition protein [Comamonadaceae bacterium]|nr:MAG: ParB/RepB/Spo0J family partition protein [Comamonadaceae bacterium]
MATDIHDQVTARIPTEPFMGMVAINLIEESLTNPRKTFNQEKLGELADSIRASGVHQPILLRPLPGSRIPDTWGFRRKDAPLPVYELVAGARRYRASLQAKVAEIPAMVRDLTDDQALEIQLIENLQREDMTELEEAEGYRALMKHSNLTAEQVAEKIGKKDQKNKGLSYVYARLKLLDLHADARKALGDGVIDSSRALRIARIPDAKLQAKALAEASRKNYRGDPAIGVREFEGWLQQNVMLRLDTARFNIVAVDLVPDAGSCKDCPNRTGADPDLFADVNSPDLCTLPKCFHAKEAAHSTALREQAAAKGMRVIEGKEAKGVVNLQSWDGHGNMLKGYTRLDSIRCDVAEGLTAAPLRELLGEGGPQPVLIEHPQSKELIEAVPTDEAEALLVQRGVLKATRTKIDIDQRINILKQQSANRQERAAMKAIYTAFLNGAHTSASPAKVMVDAELLREWLKLEVLDLDSEDILVSTGLDPVEDEDYRDTEARAAARINRAKDGELRNMMLACLVQKHAYRFGSDTGQPLVQAIARALGVNAEAIKAEAVAAEKHELKEAIAHLRAAAKVQEQTAAAKAAAPKGASTPPPAAQASASRAKSKAQKTPAARAGDSGAKTSKEHAAALIAAELSALEEKNVAPAAQGNGEQPPATAGQQGAALGVDVQVRVLPTATGKKQAPHIGKVGKILRKVGSNAWDVAIPREKRNVPMFIVFDATELQAVA